MSAIAWHTQEYPLEFLEWNITFLKCEQLFEYYIFSYLKTSGGQSSNLYLNVAHFFNARVN